MPRVEITVPEHLEIRIVQLAERGESVNRDEVIEDLLSIGICAYKASGPMSDGDRAYEDDEMMGHEDKYVF